MTKQDGYFDGDELWYRCHYCGDSQKNPNKAHCSVNVMSSLYHCFRCNRSGKLGSYDFGMITKGLKLTPQETISNPSYEPDVLIETITQKMRTGPGHYRYSALDRYHLKTQEGAKLDVFKVTNVNGDLYGYHVRPLDKSQTRTYGRRLLGMSSKIRYSETWRIVEGVYDCLDPHTDIVVFGFPSQLQAKMLHGKPLILCPDGDVFDDYRKLRAFMKSFLWDRNIIIDYIERIPNGKDPDEVLPSDRERLTPEEVRQMLKPKRSYFLDKMTPEEILADVRASIPEGEFWGT